MIEAPYPKHGRKIPWYSTRKKYHLWSAAPKVRLQNSHAIPLNPIRTTIEIAMKIHEITMNILWNHHWIPYGNHHDFSEISWNHPENPQKSHGNSLFENPWITTRSRRWEAARLHPLVFGAGHRVPHGLRLLHGELEARGAGRSRRPAILVGWSWTVDHINTGCELLHHLVVTISHCRVEQPAFWSCRISLTVTPISLLRAPPCSIDIHSKQ